MLKFNNLYIYLFFLFLFSNCKKKNCDGTNTISGRIVNGTSMQGIKGVELKFSIYDLKSNNKSTNDKELGSTITNDSGYFSFEYPCQTKDYEKISIDPLPPYVGFMNAREGYVTHFNKTYYFATNGSVQLVLKPLKPLGTDTLFLAYKEGSNSWKYQDSFIGNAPYYWKKEFGKKGGGRTIFWGRGKNNFNASLKNPYICVYPIITGDPIVDTSIVNY